MAHFHCITSVVLSGANFPPPDIVEPIHKIATHGVKFWKESDDTVFKLPKEKCIQWLIEHRAEVIRKLNANFSKLWFGWKNGWIGCRGLGDTTYEEVTLRMVHLMFVGKEGRWINLSLRNLPSD